MPNAKSKKLLLVKDGENKAVYAIKKNKEICDVDGNKLASFSKKEKRSNGKNKATISIYQSSKGTFETTGNKLFLNGNYVGTIARKRSGRSNLSLVMLAIFTTLCAIAFVMMIH